MKVKILQWNIWYKEDINHILEEIKRINPDIVCMQEVTYTKKDKSNIEKLENYFNYNYFAIAQEFIEGRIQGNGIYSKYPMKKKKEVFVQDPTLEGDYSKEGRVYIQSEISIQEKEIIIGTTHLSYTHKFQETNLKEKEVNRLIEQLKDQTNKFIFCGDLNTSKDSKYIKQIEEYLVHHNTTNTWTTKFFPIIGLKRQS